MHIGGRAALEAARRRAGRAVRKPAFGVAIIAPVVLAGAVGASAPSTVAPFNDSAVTPLAAVEPSPGTRTGASVVAVTKTPTPFHIAAATISAPPPSAVVNSPGTLRIPAITLSAYRNAERMMAGAAPGCGVSWNLLAGIGRIESLHANGGATDARGTAVRPIYGPALDGTLPGNEVIVQSAQAGRLIYARAMGPMQFLPGTWARYASDGDGDGRADVQNVYDASLAAAHYLCSGGLNLRDQSQVMAAIQNAKCCLAVQEELGSLDKYLWQFVEGQPKRNARRSMSEVPAFTPESDAMSKDLRRRGFKFVGTTICYALMQAVGMVNDHLVTCFRYKQV